MREFAFTRRGNVISVARAGEAASRRSLRLASRLFTAHERVDSDGSRTSRRSHVRIRNVRDRTRVQVRSYGAVMEEARFLVARRAVCRASGCRPSFTYVRFPLYCDKSGKICTRLGRRMVCKGIQRQRTRHPGGIILCNVHALIFHVT